MKRLIFLIALCAVMVGAAQASHRDVRINFSFFYSSLSPHGEWIEAGPDFYVWRPFHISPGWHPYVHGRWVWTSYGWYWVSYEPFGWAVFHYGRWYYDDFYGWVWIPGYDWGPAWVEWRYNDDYIGWAPLPPYATFRFSVGIYFTRTWAAPLHYWTFIGCRDFTTRRVIDYVVPIERTRRFFGSTRTSTRYVVEDGRIVNRGIDVGFAERRGGKQIERVEISETRERGKERLVRDDKRTRIEVYRPNKEDVERESAAKIHARQPERHFPLDLKDATMSRQHMEDRREIDMRKKTERKVYRERPSLERQIDGDTRTPKTRNESPEKRGERSLERSRSDRKR